MEKKAFESIIGYAEVKLELMRILDQLENPEKYAPSGVYIMRIHGTFVNFLDLSPEIQQDIINVYKI